MHFVGFCIAVCLIAVASGEVCTSNGNCQDTTCAGASTVICQHPEGGGVVDNGGLCTCSDTPQGGCGVASDCYGDKAPNLQCPDSMRHCYDGQCICDRFPTGRK